MPSTLTTVARAESSVDRPSPRTKFLFYADDIVTSSDCPTDLQRALESRDQASSHIISHCDSSVRIGLEANLDSLGKSWARQDGGHVRGS